MGLRRECQPLLFFLATLDQTEEGGTAAVPVVLGLAPPKMSVSLVLIDLDV